jgi:hypothetical protein
MLGIRLRVSHNSLLPNDLLPMDLRNGFHHFRLHPAMRKCFTVRVVMVDGTERYFSNSCFSSDREALAIGSLDLSRAFGQRLPGAP